ncbi:Conserved hypothetical protein [Micromonospora lupini str. Lupac 08]|uniref:Uncharacterized protein n=1 Tax=Micromonospora lupini str. Lupac 08 TaxID=1150864 RepID=I0KXH3_9ACTN|nr:Conserved hypothetical protein [Micromonospora lupini str. Lupac 08]
MVNRGSRPPAGFLYVGLRARRPTWWIAGIVYLVIGWTAFATICENGVTGEGVVDDFRPNGGVAAAPTSVNVGAYESDATVLNLSVTAYAICANPLPGLVRASVVGASNSLDFRSVVATCPVGKVLTGAGYELNGVTGEGIVDDFRPNGGPATAPVSAASGAYEEDAFAGNWSDTGYAICATA